jgi:S-adenosylmethionine synthetase
VTIEYAFGRPKRVATVLVSAQHAPGTSPGQIQEGIIEEVIKPVLPAGMDHDGIRYFVNPTGSFEIGGPMGDSGLTGRKIIVDTYGGMGRHGGGCFSGKDPTKVDRSGAYAARWVAKHIVAAGLAERCEIQVAYAIGVAHPLSVNVETFGTGRLPDEALAGLIGTLFDLRPGAIIRDLELRRPLYQPVAAYGHFGRADLDLPWERLTRLEALKSAAGAGAKAA